MNVLIIEDEEAASSRLKQMLTYIDDTIEVSGILESVKETVKWLKENELPDLAFFDIQLADGLSFNIFTKVDISCPIIFTTAYDQYAIEAFKVNSIDYLLKPINPDALQKSLIKYKKLKNVFKSAPSSEQLKKLLIELSRGKKNYKSRFLVNKGDILLPILTDDIAYFYTEEKVVFLVTNTDKKHIIGFTLDNLEQQLDPEKFFRANRQFIISINAIHKVHTYFNYKLKVEIIPEPESGIIVSRTRVNDFKNWLNQ